MAFSFGLNKLHLTYTSIGDYMHMVDNIKTFLYDKKYFINIFNQSIYVFNYINLEKLSDTQIILELETFRLQIDGHNLRVNKMVDNEIQIIGDFSKLEFLK